MYRIRLSGFGSIVCFAIAGALLLAGLSFAQDVTQPSLKAAFIYNVAKFTGWPPEVMRNSGTIEMCVLGDAAVHEALEHTVKDRSLLGHNIAVSYLAPNAPQRPCHILYLSGVPSNLAERVIAGLRDVPVLTISDIEGFTSLGGMVELFFEHGQLRFSIQNDSAKRAHLLLSAKLLELSKRK